MQYALCRNDGKTWEAYAFSRLGHSELSDKRNNLICTMCGALAWFRKESTHGHPAHFCAHHNNECELKAEYVVVDQDKGDGTEAVDMLKSSGDIIVRLDKEKGGDIDVAPPAELPGGPVSQDGRTHLVKGGDRLSSQEFTLRRILHRLVQSPDFRNSSAKLTFFKKGDEPYISGCVKDITRAFSEISKEETSENPMFYWGPITSVKTTPDGKIWLNSSPQYQSVSVAIFPDIADDFINSFNIDELDDLAGAHILVSGKCFFTGKQQSKPIIWCGAVNQIVIRRYRAANLQIAG